MLPGKPKRGAARDEQRQLGCRAEQIAEERGSLIDDLEVVEQQEDPPVAQMLPHRRRQRLVALLFEAERISDRRGDERRVAQV